MLLTIQSVKDNGKMIVLSDGSHWAIGAMDVFKTSIWMWNDKIEVGPLRLTNLTRKQAVSAQRA